MSEAAVGTMPAAVDGVVPSPPPERTLLAALLSAASLATVAAELLDVPLNVP